MDFTVEEIAQIIGTKDLEILVLKRHLDLYTRILDEELPDWRKRFEPTTTTIEPQEEG